MPSNYKSSTSNSVVVGISKAPSKGSTVMSKQEQINGKPESCRATRKQSTSV